MNILLPIIFLFFINSEQGFLEQQKKFPRVKNAIAEKETALTSKIAAHGIKLNDMDILMVAYKQEGELELYMKKKTEDVYSAYITYKICAKSGRLGPKRKQGDNQVPEGFYHISHYNPKSSYHLSLKINYPNGADRIKSKYPKLGGDICIHGNCVTIGCLPMTDEKMKEIYLLAIHAKNNGQENIPVYIFPFKMTDNNFHKYKNNYGSNQELIDFWTNLKTGYDSFTQNLKQLNVSVNKNGDYTYKL